METRIPSHQSSSRLYVWGRPEKPREGQPPTMASCSEPYTSGKNLVSSVKCLIFPLWIQNFNPSSSSSQLSTRPTRSRPNSGHLCRIRFPSNQYPSHIAPHIYELSTLHHSLQMVRVVPTPLLLFLFSYILFG